DRGGRAAAPLHQNLPGPSQEAPHERVAVQLLLGQVPGAVARLDQHVGVGKRIEVGDVIPGDQKGSFLGDVLHTFESPVEPKGQGRPDGHFGESIQGFWSAHSISRPQGAAILGPAVQIIAVPVKELEASKSRLSSVLSQAERAVLSLAMFEDVLDACQAQTGWDVWVISRAE